MPSRDRETIDTEDVVRLYEKALLTERETILALLVSAGFSAVEAETMIDRAANSPQTS